MADKDDSFLWKSLKWTFKAAAWVTFGFVGVEFLSAGIIHGLAPLSKYLAANSVQFMDPVMHAAGNLIDNGSGIEASLSWVTDILRGIHRMFGITGTFEPTNLVDSLDSSVMGVGGGAGLGMMPGMN